MLGVLFCSHPCLTSFPLQSVPIISIAQPSPVVLQPVRSFPRGVVRNDQDITQHVLCFLHTCQQHCRRCSDGVSGCYGLLSHLIGVNLVEIIDLNRGHRVSKASFDSCSLGHEEFARSGCPRALLTPTSIGNGKGLVHVHSLIGFDRSHISVNSGRSQETDTTFLMTKIALDGSKTVGQGGCGTYPSRLL